MKKEGKDVSGLLKEMKALSEEIKKLDAEVSEVEEELKSLATQRARHVRELLLQTGKTTADRLFLLEPKTLAPEKKDKIRDSRVDFSLK